MNIKNSIWGLMAAATLWVPSVLAAPAVLVGSNSVVQSTPTASISVNWDGDGTVQSAQFNITYNSANLTPTNIPAACSAPWSCSNLVPGTIIFVGDQGSPLPDVLIASITFNTATAAINTYPLNVTSQLFVNSVPASVPPSGTTNGSMTITAGPQPLYASTPAPGALNLGTVAQEATDPTSDVVINNTGGEVGSTLAGTCSNPVDPDNVFTLSGDTSFSVPQAGPADTVTVTCDSAGSAKTHTGTMSCSHNGSNASPQVYNLSCTITGPAYTSNPVATSSLNFTTTQQGDTDPTKTIDVTNTGGTGTKLDVTCTDTVDPDAVFSVSSGSPIVDLLPSGGAKVVTVTCDSAKKGNHTGTLSCAHNGTNTTPATYPLSCSIKGPASYSSNPVAGQTINLTPPGGVAHNASVPTKPLVITNNATAPASDLYTTCGLTGSSQITQSPIGAGQFTLAPQASATANFACDTTECGAALCNYSATYSCDYKTTSAGSTANASYTVKCDVRDAHAVVVVSPANGTPQEATVPPGGNHTFSFVFSETADEDVDGTVESCTLSDGTNYQIVSPAFPATITAGGSVTVQVKGTDPGGVDNFADQLNCVYSDTEHPFDDDVVFGQPVNWPLNIVVGGDASFNVRKEFSDGPGNPTEVDVTISCNTGLPLIQSQTISETQDVTFIVKSFDTGELNCNITEDLSDPALAGYTPQYYKEQSEVWDADSCEYSEVDGGDKNYCTILNKVDPVPVEITKDWIIEGMGGDQIDQHFELTLYCDTEIVGVPPNKGVGYPSCNQATLGAGKQQQDDYCLVLEGEGDTTFTPEVIPEWPSSHCWVGEQVYDDAVEVDNGCGNLTVSHGQGTSCLITNTVFFEGIPTLNQYGMALLALLMLGVGLVGFRRFV